MVFKKLIQWLLPLTIFLIGSYATYYQFAVKMKEQEYSVVVKDKWGSSSQHKSSFSTYYKLELCNTEDLNMCAIVNVRQSFWEKVSVGDKYTWVLRLKDFGESWHLIPAILFLSVLLVGVGCLLIFLISELYRK